MTGYAEPCVERCCVLAKKSVSELQQGGGRRVLAIVN